MMLALHVDGAAVFPLVLECGGAAWLTNVMCIGNETSIIDCPSDPIGQQSCDEGQTHAGVRCRGNLHQLVGARTSSISKN